MSTYDEYFEIIKCKVSTGTEYSWNCYGETAYEFSCESPDDIEYTISMVFDTTDKTVYELTALDYENGGYYRWVHPDFKDALYDECETRGVEFHTAFDNTDYCDIELDVFLRKAAHIVDGVTKFIDNYVLVPLDIPDDMLFILMTKAHEADVTLNAYIEQILIDRLMNC